MTRADKLHNLHTKLSRIHEQLGPYMNEHEAKCYLEKAMHCLEIELDNCTDALHELHGHHRKCDRASMAQNNPFDIF